jgi:hypothetical protein
MNFAAIEFNDQSLLIEAEDGAMHAEPGYARLTPEGAETGEAVRSAAWREPQHVYNQFWCQLNQSPLPNRHRFARHYADIAFAQLRTLWQSAGSPDSMVLLVPGSFSRTQLALLLGMAGALPCTVDAVVDSALAACAGVGSDTLFVDLQLHESVLTVCGPRGDTVRVLGQEVFPGLGMCQIQNSLARHISDIMIESYRTDPLHASDTEQAIFDGIPGWLARLCWESDVSVTVQSEQGEKPCVLHRDAIKAQVGERLGSLRSFLDKWKDCNLLLSHVSAPLRGLVDEFADAPVAERSAATGFCLASHEELAAPDGELNRLREIKRTKTAGHVPGTDTSLATHVLCGDRALPLEKPLSIRLEENGPRIRSEFDEDSALTVVLRNGALEILNQDAEATLPAECTPGEKIRVGEYELRLIRVDGG